jgi:hypothetical protein
MMQMNLLDQLASEPSPSTVVRESILAAGSVDANQPRKVRHYLAILRCLRDQPGSTDDEGQAATGLPGNSYRPRRGELHGARLLCHEPGGLSSAGHPARRWFLTNDGLGVLTFQEASA